MGVLAREFACKEFTLSVSFRCPQAIVEAARVRVPHMKWNQRGGHVETLRDLLVEDIPDGAAFICRCNAPLFQLALRLLTHGRGASMVGTDLGPSLVRTLKRLGDPSLSKKDTLHAIASWEAERLVKAKDKATVTDKAECLRVFADFGATLGGAITYAEHIFKNTGSIQLLSGHKAKGLEWDTVYHLDPWRIPSPYAESPEELAQELNLQYVITTRAKHSLFYVDLADIEHGSPALLCSQQAS
jgi:hypothetical protein